MSLVCRSMDFPIATNRTVARKALSTFSTPGFGNKQAPSQMTRQRSDVIDISSDDGPSNSSLKRDSSSYSILEDNPAPSSKRLRTEKVNILGTSTRVNQLSSTSGYTKDTPFDSLITSMMALLDPHEVGKVYFPQDYPLDLKVMSLASSNQMTSTPAGLGTTTSSPFLRPPLPSFTQQARETPSFSDCSCRADDFLVELTITLSLGTSQHEGLQL